MVRPVKLRVDTYTNDPGWNPSNKGSKMPDWTELQEGEYLLGSVEFGEAFSIVPLKILQPESTCPILFLAGSLWVGAFFSPIVWIAHCRECDSSSVVNCSYFSYMDRKRTNTLSAIFY